MKKLMMLTLIIIMICFLFNSTCTTKDTSFVFTNTPHISRLHAHIMPATNDENLTLAPVYMVNITLANGSVIGFQNVDNATTWIINAIRTRLISIGDISRIDFILVRNWGKIRHFINVSANETINATYYPGYRLFFVRLFNASQFNYTGEIGAVMYNDWFSQEIGYSLYKFIYGPLPEINATTIFNNTITSYNLISGLSVIVLINSSFENTSVTILREISKISDDVQRVIIIDLSNNQTQLLRILNITNITTDFLPILDCNITIRDDFCNVTYNTSLEAFGFAPRVPALLTILDGMVIWKSCGIASLNEFETTLSTLHEFGILGIAKYDLLNVTAVNLLVNETATIYISISDGLGNISVSATYEFLTEKNETIGEIKNISAKLIHPKVFAVYGIFVPNGSRYLRIFVKVDTEFTGTMLYGPFIFKVKVKEKPSEELGPKIEQIAGAIAGVIILIVLIYVYKKLR